ncbi:hypothetical protein LH407_11300 [Antiquaquibacter oligotrophicus]|uniref:hypothetical protein n=1 Tax=Antiquaquibacter oligotrophicus TaxID=2880260 RepID=UPI002AC98548|nr:hypothetical protein [Antiquaquibacter oligotrophicus]UDF12736.1 hypothetical protein LH407_11300 [Antiquaquibacter oligotrophicus]
MSPIVGVWVPDDFGEWGVVDRDVTSLGVALLITGLALLAGLLVLEAYFGIRSTPPDDS